MIEKHSDVLAFDPILGQQVFVLSMGDGLEKTASIVKEAQASPEIEEAVKKLEKKAGNSYILVNAIGSGEYWSSNRNGDYFPESGLKHAGDDYGYQTFLSGHNFLHHENKDPQKAVGTVKVAHYNPRMHRVELILETNLDKLCKADPEVYEKVASGQPVDVSMGSKCDFDVCSICSHRASTRAEYCGHLKSAMNQIFEDGKKAYAYTPHPRFFDISFVKRGADVTAKALQYLPKAASDGFEAISKTASAPVVACPDPSLHETVSCEESYEIPEFPVDHKFAVAVLETAEPAIPGKLLTEMGKVGFNESLSTLTHLGIVLSPEEYQKIALVALGLESTADHLEANRASIDPSSAGSWFDPDLKVVGSQVDPANFNPKVAEIVLPFIKSRTIREPYFSERLAQSMSLPDRVFDKLASEKKLEKDAASFMTPELAAALALGYLIYRKGIPVAKETAIERAIHDPSMSRKVLTVIIPLIAAGSVVDKMLSFEPPTGSREKRAGIGTQVIAPVAATYLYSAYARRKAERGEPISGLQHLFLDYPLPIALGGVAGMAGLKRSLQRTMAKSGGMIADGLEKDPGMDKNASVLADLLLAVGSGIYRPRLSGALGFLADVAIGSGIASGVKGVAKLVTGTPEK